MSKVKKMPRASGIQNVEDLRDYGLRLLEKLEGGEIDIKEAGVTAKICETIMTTARAQIEYARACGREPNVAFMGNCLGDYTTESGTRRRKMFLESPGFESTLDDE